MKKILLIVAVLLSVDVFASGGGAHLEPAQTNIRSKESLQNGAKYFMNYCSGCHSLQYQRYNRMAQDLGLTKEEVVENLIFTDSKFPEHMTNTMDNDQVKKQEWFHGAYPKDLTLVAKARGVDWIYAYLKSFYKDPSRPIGWNNTVFKDVTMPNVLWELQGIQEAKFDEHKAENGMVSHEFKKFKKISDGTMSDEEFDNTVRDIVNFLDYTAEPARLIRMDLAPWVLFFLVILTMLAYLLKKNYFKDIH